eukprot:GHVN01099909.1.p1 GENE.GHVN01099909.1~~GHVN01099909.1.p1  ORF type:complete len:207 (-),score=5.06 GHVN01099909.1:1075-1695(-)
MMAMCVCHPTCACQCNGCKCKDKHEGHCECACTCPGCECHKNNARGKEEKENVKTQVKDALASQKYRDLGGDIFKPSAPHPYYHLAPLFREGSLSEAMTKTPKKWQDLRGKSVALFFGNSASPKTNNFFPHLLQMYKVFNENGDSQKIEIVYVPLEPNRELFEKERRRHPWLTLDIDDEIVNDLKQHFRVMNPPDLPKYGNPCRDS